MISYAKDRIAGHMAGPHGSPIVLRWVVQSGVMVDVTTGAHLSASSPAARTETVNGMVHYVGPILSQMKQFQEVTEGNAIIDLPADTVVEGREELEFLIDGKVWVGKDLSEQLRNYWDVYIGGQRLYRTVLVELKG